MVIAFCNLSIVPLRAAASHRSEMVNQVLFGELIEIIQEEADWALVRMIETNYEGWLQIGQYALLPADGQIDITKKNTFVVGPQGATAIKGDVLIHLVAGTTFAQDTSDGAYMPFSYHIKGDVRPARVDDFAQQLASLVRHYQDSPYLWGGRSTFGIDCSGLTKAIYSQFGVSLPRDAYQQADVGTVVDFLTEIKPGDLAFFDNEEGRITHVGIMLHDGLIFHASARVRLDSLDSEGIYNKDRKRYTHKLRIVKRYIHSY